MMTSVKTIDLGNAGPTFELDFRLHEVGSCHADHILSCHNGSLGSLGFTNNIIMCITPPLPSMYHVQMIDVCCCMRLVGPHARQNL